MKYRYAEMMWNECRDVAAAERVAVLPVATHEDHGPHLPIDTDVVLTNEICERAVASIPSEAVLAPPVKLRQCIATPWSGVSRAMTFLASASSDSRIITPALAQPLVSSRLATQATICPSPSSSR